MPVSYKRKNSMKKSKSSKGSKSSKLSKRVKTRKSTKTKKRLTRKSKNGSVVRKMRGGVKSKAQKNRIKAEALAASKRREQEIKEYTHNGTEPPTHTNARPPKYSSPIRYKNIATKSPNYQTPPPSYYKVKINSKKY